MCDGSCGNLPLETKEKDAFFYSRLNLNEDMNLYLLYLCLNTSQDEEVANSH